MPTGNPIVSCVLAAGASTRMKSSRSKLLHEVLGRPVCHWALDQAQWIGDSIVFVVGHQRDEVEKSLKSAQAQRPLKFAHQDKPLGTGHAVQCALAEIESLGGPQASVFIMGGDAFLLERESLEAFAHQHFSSGSRLSLMTSYFEQPGAYGRIIRNSSGQVEAIVEKKDATADQLKIKEVNAGFYLVSLQILKAALQGLSNSNKAGEFYLTDLVSFCRRSGHLVSAFLIQQEECLGINNQMELAQASRVMQTRINAFWMSQGVQMLSPETTWIDSNAQLSADVTLEPGVIIKGESKIFELARIGAYSVVENSDVGPGSILEAYSHLKEARLKRHCHVGPFVRMRPGTVCEDNVHLGNFVETKKARLGRGVKAGHLTYLGDAEIGPESNIGAGTITCNYDGILKHETTIGEKVFIGSNTSLVAPVRVGAGAMVGAGSVITKDVSPGAIAVERAEQREVAGGAERFRSKKQSLKKGI